jgi:hypothetical protein
MAGEIQLGNLTTGGTYYVVLFNQAGQALTTGTTFATYDTAQQGNYDQPMTETPAGSGRFHYNFPAVAVGNYNWTIYEQQGGAPSYDDDIPIAEDGGYWNGTVFGAVSSVTGAVGSVTAGVTATTPDTLQSTTIATLTSQTSFTLTAGSADNDAYNDCYAIITDQSTSTQKAFAPISDYVGSTRTVTLEYDPAIFTMATGDSISIVASPIQRVSPFTILPDHTWKFDRPSQVTAPNLLNEGQSGNVLVQMDFTTALAGDSIDTISSVTVSDESGKTEPTIVKTAKSADSKKVIITTNTASASTLSSGYTYNVTITTVDGQTLTRKGKLVVQ